MVDSCGPRQQPARDSNAECVIRHPKSWPLRSSFADSLPNLCTAADIMPVAEPQLIYVNNKLITSLIGSSPSDEQTNTNAHPTATEADLAHFFAGQALPPGTQPIAQAYGGHQFGRWNPVLGDGRAALLGEIETPAGKRIDLALKGSGPTAFSRGGDGMAAVGPMLREVLISEFLAASGIPTTRCAAVVATNIAVQRKLRHPGAVLARTAATHIRVGTFELVAQHGDKQTLARLADFEIARNYPAIDQAKHATPSLKYREFLSECAFRQADLVAEWLGLGFIHGVMNTDNTACSGESIDFGPCAFMEEFSPTAVFSSIDSQGRYAYQKQPEIAVWNIQRLATSLVRLLDEDPNVALKASQAVTAKMIERSSKAWSQVLRRKFGLTTTDLEDEQVILLAAEWFGLLHRDALDFTLSWRHLAELTRGNDTPLRQACTTHDALDTWIKTWTRTCQGLDPHVQAAAMDAQNPCHTPRNHLVEKALAAAEQGDLEPFNELLSAVQSPYTPGNHKDYLREPAPTGFTAQYRTFCGT